MGLSFLSPLLLGGAALVVAPIILHMVMRRTPVPHTFPALRFLKERAIANRRRLQLSHLLLLLVRMAAILLLALSLARPVLRGAGWLPDAEGPVAAALVFDTAPRMMLRAGNRTRLEQAVTLARGLLDKLPAESRIAVLDTTGTPAAFDPTRAATEVRLDRLDAATPSRSLPAAIADARRLLETADLERRELYVFTDCSHGAWDDAPSQEADDGEGPSVLYVDVAAESPRNLAIESLELSGDRVAAGTPLVVAATVSRTGSDATRAAAVEIIDDDGRPVRRGMKPVEPRPGGPVTVAFEVAGLKPGTRQGRIVLDGSDDLAADDVRSFTVEVGSAARVLLAAERPAAATARFLVEALAPAPLRLAGTARFAPEPLDYEALDAAKWDDAAGIVLVDPPVLAERQWEALGEWVAQGRGLVVWLGPAAGEAAAFNTAAARRVLGGELTRVWRSPDAGNFLAPAALGHPILAAFRRVGDDVPWQDFPVFRHWEFTPSPPPADAAEPEQAGGPAAVVATYRNGLPAILERRLGQGTVVVVTTPVSRAAGDPAAWNTLATGFEPWPFVILANETLLHAVATPDDRNVIAGRPATLHLGRRDLPTALVRTPGGDDFPVAIDRARGTVTITATLEPGNYAVRAGGQAAGVADGFSVNLGPAATDFRRLSPDDLTRVLGPGHRLARTEEEIVRDVNLERIGTELFGWGILVAAIAMAADWILANRFYKPREPEATENAVAGFEDLDGEAPPRAEDDEEALAAGAARSATPPPLPPLTGSAE
ncbi:MAG: BatA domain-containing protein [Planctomycetota bacterium]